MRAVQRMDLSERRRRLAGRHGLAPPARFASPSSAAASVVALHATDPATVFLAVAARTSAGGGEPCPQGEVERSLYESRELVRMLGMRRTMFVVPVGLVPVVHRSTMRRIARTQRALLCGQLRDLTTPASSWEDWLADVERGVLRALEARGGTASASELAADEPRLRTTLNLAAGKPYAARPAITSRVLQLLGIQGHIVRGRPAGSWLSQQYRWSLAESWVRGLFGVGAPGWPDDDGGPSEREAGSELARRWLAAYGPAPLSDLRWWTGWSAAQVRKAVGGLDVAEVDAGGQPCLVLADDLDPDPDPGPWAALLPALDPSVMGWSDRSWFMGSHDGALMDRSGNVGPTVWLSGRVVGGWAQRRSGEIAVRLLEDVGTDCSALIEAETERLARWLGSARVVPKFRTPVERELSG